MKANLFILMMSLFVSLTACSQTESNLKSQTASEFKKSIANESVVLIDVRTTAEYSAGHIPNSINIDVNDPDFATKVKKLLKPENKLALYCRSGRRSKLAVSKLNDIKNTIFELDHGFNDWLASGYTIKN